MKKVVSISGGKTSAFLAANYQSDEMVFALIRTSDKRCLFPDRILAKKVEDRIGKAFIGTLEDDTIITTIFDLEQYLGRKIHWVSGDTFDDVIKTKGGWLPNKLHRYCTQFMKIKPLFEWWSINFDDPVEMMIGFRSNEVNRAKRMLDRVDDHGLLSFKTVVGKFGTRNKWSEVPWQRPSFPLIDDQIFKQDIEKFWDDKPVRFAPLNNCVGCFHRSVGLLKKMSEIHPLKLKWFADQEGENQDGKFKGFWRSDVSYKKIIESDAQFSFSFDDETFCGSGYCGIN